MPTEIEQRARAWRHAAHAAVCDVLEPWTHGTVALATHLPDVWDCNVVRVEEPPRMSAGELAAFADEALDGLAHRRIDLEVAGAEALRPAFDAAGWRTTRLVWMRHDGATPAGETPEVHEVPYDAVYDLRVAWHAEDFPGSDPQRYLEQVRGVALARGARVLAVLENGVPVAFAQLEHDGGAAEVTQVYVRPDRRGAGRGTAMTRAAIRAAGAVDDLWIVADDEDRPKELYTRLGFGPAWRMTECLRAPVV